MEPKSARFQVERRESSSSNPNIDVDVLKSEIATERARPFDQFQYLDVTFNSVANGNTDIAHNLNPPTVDDIDVQVVRWKFAAAPAAAPVIYYDTSATRKAWGNGYLVVKCNVASAVATLLLTVRRT